MIMGNFCKFRKRGYIVLRIPNTLHIQPLRLLVNSGNEVFGLVGLDELDRDTILLEQDFELVVRLVSIFFIEKKNNLLQQSVFLG